MPKNNTRPSEWPDEHRQHLFCEQKGTRVLTQSRLTLSEHGIAATHFFFNYQMIDHNLMIDHNFDDDWWLITMFLNFRIFVCLWMLNAPVQLVKPTGFGHTDQGLCSLDPRHLWMSKNFLKINGSRPGKDHQNRWGHGVLFCKLRGIKHIYPSKRWQCNVRNMAIYSRFWHILTIYGGNLVNSW